ncbi:asparagine synthase (glutamine-hydrolyzing) [Roseisolibacter sp. H3M3-2]|uniref:asparagine synthase (glutamine-hydrolyzing) n=1 Tax=Roseisolibacter sp. H3M3-2 TaxID=3031323 RepID=UPI0023DA3896|nr:asparagine synthase (glutamine-hydrolyzing) [Roseisolibacter sp. H3M3-2]MDF1502345.1 asparagine synthase (glutamine-hydrolyzing) [Roseisolibacter sp. H3M3-2]
MCGILAALSRPGAPVAPHEHVMDALRHRGPDGRGSACVTLLAGVDASDDAPAAWLGHLRLSILDLSARGAQPMTSGDGRFVATYNGEIYNYVELRRELEADGARFRTGTDTEVLIEAWARWGESSLRRFEGMYAFVLVDRARRTATLARDAFGIKPLYYAETEAGLLVASEPLPLVRAGRLAPDLDPEVAYEYLRFGATNANDRTLLRGVRALPPASVATFDFDAGALRAPRTYWQLRPTERAISLADAAAECRERFLDNVRLHLRSDVPVGAALSGGIDSSAVVCAMRRLEPDLDLQTFSYIATEAGKSEERWVDLVHAQVGGACHKIRPAAEMGPDDLTRLIRHQGEPFGSASVYAQYLVFERARREGVTVTLDGQGADELLAGYWPYVGTRAAELARRGDLAGCLRLVTHAAPGARGVAHTSMMLAQAALPPGLRRLARGLVRREVFPSYLDRGWFAGAGVDADALAEDLIGRHATMKDHLVSTVERGSLPNLLRYADRNSMAHSVESRVPFLTMGFAEFLLSLPSEHLLSPDGERKHVFREAMRGILPEPIRARRDKIGFFADDALWLRRHADRYADVWEELAREPMFDGAELRTFVSGFHAGRHDKAQLVWRALTFGLWLRELRSAA